MYAIETAAVVEIDGTVRAMNSTVPIVVNAMIGAVEGKVMIFLLVLRKVSVAVGRRLPGGAIETATVAAGIEIAIEMEEATIGDAVVIAMITIAEMAIEISTDGIMMDLPFRERAHLVTQVGARGNFGIEMAKARARIAIFEKAVTKEKERVM